MRIALYANVAHPVPPAPGKILAPWMLTAELANRLVDRGHEVTLFAAKESLTKAPLVHEGISIESFWVDGKEDLNKIAFLDHVLLSNLYQRAQRGQFDIIHIHHSITRSIYFAPLTTTPSVITLHDPIAKQPYVYEWFINTSQLHITPISEFQKTANPNLPYTEVVYNGVDTDIYTYVEQPRSYLLIAGRIVPEKGIHTAIRVAKKLDMPLIIAGTVNPDSPRSVTYWKEQVKPHINQRQIFYCGSLLPKQLARLYQSARAFLFPIEWDEPFGLVMAEAMACGTPVIAFKRGSVPEVVKNHETGFIVSGEQEMIEAVGKAGQISPQACRQHAEQSFSLEAMVVGYEKVYRSVVAQPITAAKNAKYSVI